MLNQDDPKKCSALKLIRFGAVLPAKSIHHSTLVLNPFATHVVCRTDKTLVDSICVIDCSWNRAESILTSNKYLRRGIPRKIPALLAGNPINYARLGRLSSVESLSACYYVLGEKNFATSLLDKFKWGHTFLELNHDVLEDYSYAENRDEIMKVEMEYFGSHILKND